MQRSRGRNAIEGEVELLTPPRERGVVRRLEVGAHQGQDRPQEALRLAQGQPDNQSKCQRGLDREVRELPQLSPGRFWSFACEFSPFTARDGDWTGTLIPDTVLPSIRRSAVYSSDGCGSVCPAVASGGTGRQGPWSKGPSATGGHAAASSDGHASHDADRFASPRARRAAAALDVRSADTASPVPKYISSGVCPRNAECGSPRVCSST